MGALIDLRTLGPFLAAVLLIELTPGPNMGYLAALSASRGRRAGLAAVVGITAGLMVYMLAAVFGLTEIFLIYRPLYEILRWAGVLYLLWLAWEAWRDADLVSAQADDDAASMAGLAWRGFLANLLNPKAAIFYITLLPAFIVEEHGSPAGQALALGGVHIAVSVLVHGAIVVGAAQAGSVIAQAGAGGRLTALRRALALSIAAIAIWLAWETRR